MTAEKPTRPSERKVRVSFVVNGVTKSVDVPIRRLLPKLQGIPIQSGSIDFCTDQSLSSEYFDDDAIAAALIKRTYQNRWESITPAFPTLTSFQIFNPPPLIPSGLNPTTSILHLPTIHIIGRLSHAITPHNKQVFIERAKDAINSIGLSMLRGVEGHPLCEIRVNDISIQEQDVHAEFSVTVFQNLPRHPPSDLTISYLQSLLRGMTREGIVNALDPVIITKDKFGSKRTLAHLDAQHLAVRRNATYASDAEVFGTVCEAIQAHGVVSLDDFVTDVFVGRQQLFVPKTTVTQKRETVDRILKYWTQIGLLQYQDQKYTLSPAGQQAYVKLLSMSLGSGALLVYPWATVTTK